MQCGRRKYLKCGPLFNLLQTFQKTHIILQQIIVQNIHRVFELVTSKLRVYHLTTRRSNYFILDSIFRYYVLIDAMFVFSTVMGKNLEQSFRMLTDQHSLNLR